MAGESQVIPTDFIFLFIIRVDPSPIFFSFYFFIWSELVRVDLSWSGPTFVPAYSIKMAEAEM